MPGGEILSQNKVAQGQDSRAQLERDAVTLCNPKKAKCFRLEALGNLLSAYALGSRTAKRGLDEYHRCFPGWRFPSKEKAMTMATDVYREARELKANYDPEDTLPGF